MIFIDTNFFIAIFLSNDYWHERSKEIIKEIPKNDRFICQSVLNEIITIAGMKGNVKACENVYNYLMDTCILFNETDISNLNNKVMKTYLRFNGAFSFTDSIIIEVMKELKIKKIMSFDKDFDKAKKKKKKKMKEFIKIKYNY